MSLTRRENPPQPLEPEELDHHETLIPGNKTSQTKRTPLPKLQLSIVLLIQFAEPITGTVIYPFINQFVRDTGVIKGDERKTGYYAGVIESAFFFAEALSALQWGWASDRFGRRPILLLAPFGLLLAMLGFGLSKHFWPLVIFRCIQGAFNGNIGVTKTVIAEITDATNVADAYALMPLIWIPGITLGPTIGGLLSQPTKRWPKIFGGTAFFYNYPYFLPCAVAGLIALIPGVIALIGLKETSPAIISRKKVESNTKLDSTTRLLDSDNTLNYGSNDGAERLGSNYLAEPGHTPSPITAIFIPPVFKTLTVNMFLTFVDMCVQVLLPLMYSTSISLGGLGFDPYRIGIIMGTYGVVNTVFQLLFMGKLIRMFGPRTIQIIAHACYFGNIALYPLLSYFVRRAGGADWKAWSLIVFQFALRLTNAMAFGSIQIFIVDSAPARAALGATNGLAHACGSIARSIAPSVASSLFSVSLESRLAGGNMVYLILSGIALIGFRCTFMLPKQLKSEG